MGLAMKIGEEVFSWEVMVTGDDAMWLVSSLLRIWFFEWVGVCWIHLSVGLASCHDVHTEREGRLIQKTLNGHTADAETNR